MTVVLIDMSEVGGSTILAQSVVGRLVCRRLLELADREPSSPQPLFLDFVRVEIATASFLRESVITFSKVMRSRRSSYYPIVANPNDTVREELLELLLPRGEVVMSCVIDAFGVAAEMTPLGNLDPKQRLTFDLVVQYGETDAADLIRRHGSDEGIKRTAWNNRLSSLVDLGLILEINAGRGKRYRPLLGGV